MKGGLKLESLKFSDHNFEKVFGSDQAPIVPLNRDISNLPVVCQGDQNTCVSCTVTWIKQWYEQSGIQLSWPYLAEKSGTDADGVKPSKVLDAAYHDGICPWPDFNTPNADQTAEAHKIPGYSYVRKYDLQTLYNAIKLGPIAVGLTDYQGVGPHMMAAYDVTEDGKGIRCVNWWDPNVQQVVDITADQVEVAISLHPKPEGIPNITMPPLSVIKDKIVTFFKQSPLRLVGLILILLAGGDMTVASSQPQKYGSAGVDLGYSPSIAAPGISSTATSVPVSSITLYTGETIQPSLLHFPVYFVANPNSPSTQELVECWGLSTSTVTPNWTGCVRGLSAQGGPTTSTVTGAAFPHAAGEKFVMTNAPPFFNRFVDTFSAQVVGGLKTFLTNVYVLGDLIHFGSGSNNQRLEFENSQTLKPYFRIASDGSTSSFYFSPNGVDEFQLNASGTVVGASTTRAIFITDGLVGVSASTTAGMAFDSNGKLYVPLATSGTITYLPDGSLYSPTQLIPGFFGDGSDGASTTAGTVTLNRDYYFTNYTIATGTTVITNGFRVFVNGTFTNNGTIHNDGITGIAGGNAPNINNSINRLGGGAMSGAATSTNGFTSASPFAAFFPAGSWGASGSHGGDGQDGGGGSGNVTGATGTVGVIGFNEFLCRMTSLAGTSGPGGVGTRKGSPTYPIAATGSVASTCSSFASYSRSSIGIENFLQAGYASATSQTLGSSAAGGASGSGGGTTLSASTCAAAGGGGGGSGGGGGGVLYIAAKTFINHGTIRSKGGAGGAGGTGGSVTTGGTCSTSAGAGGGGGGGGGGLGGFVILIAYSYSSDGTVSSVGGSGGSGGAAGSTTFTGDAPATAGSNGNAGNSGTTFLFTN